MNRLLALLIFSASLAWAQTTSTEILGTVTDPTGALIPGAKVTLRRLATGEVRDTVTTSKGDYAFPLIDIGEYRVTVEAPGFKVEEKRGITVQLQQKARVDFQLQVGQASERIEVIASGVVLKTDDAAVGQVIDNKRIVELPLNGRNIATLAVLTPGVQFGVRMGLDGSGSASFPIPGSIVAVSANGQREVNQQITLDGVIATESRINTMVFTPSIDAIEEFKVQTSSYSAEYGQNNGAIIQIALKSGTNDFKGTLYEFIRNDAFDAKDYFLNFQLPAGARLQPKNRLRRNQFGAFTSGPVLIPKIYNGKDRTFWSFNYEGRRETQEFVQEAFWFPQEFRNGDFSSLLTPLVRNGRAIRSPIIVYDPTNGEPFRDSSGRITNIIPASRINRSAQSFVNKYQPLPMFTPEDKLDINARSSVPNIIKSNQAFFRIDHQLSSHDKMFVRYAMDRSQYDNLNINPNFPTFTSSRANNVAVQHIHIFSPTVLNEFRYGLNKADDAFTNPRSNTDFDLDSLGIGQYRVATDGNRKLKPVETGIPSTLIGGDRDLGNGFDFNTVHQFADNVSLSRGSHTFKAGIEYRWIALDRAGGNTKRGAAGCCEGGYSMAGWLLGYPSSSTTGEGSAIMNARQNRWGAYFLDDWKVSRKLTLNLGMRWDYFLPPVDRLGGWRSLRLDILTQASDGQRLPTLIPAPGTKNFQFYDRENRFFMPRVGFAYRLTDKWVIRGGGGWFANAQQLNNFSILILMPPKSGTFAFNQVTDAAQVIQYEYNGQTFPIQTRRFRPGSQVLTLDSLFPGAGTGPARTNLTVMPPDNKSTNHWQWSFDLQRSLPWNTQLTIGYVGSKTNNLDASVANFNSPDPSTDTDFNRRRPWQAFVGQGEGNAPRALGSIRYLDSYGNGSYQGLQTSVDKRYSGGLTMGLSYTYSKALGEGYGRNESGAGVGGDFQDPRNRRSSRSRFGFDVTHNAVFNFVYEMPFLNHFKGVPGFFLAGWQSNGVVTMRTGFPFNLGGGNLNNSGSSRPDRVADGRLGSNASRQRWFDPTAFRRNDCNIPRRADLCHYGSSGDGVLTTPGARNFDLSLYKNWKLPVLGEGGRFQFRAEFFNAFNTPMFGQPNGISFATLDSIVPDGPRDGEIRSLRQPMRIIQFGAKIYF
ncbi:MAG: TonB-dependent receptor domain-containing protein [Bryobacteraceae bacterium]